MADITRPNPTKYQITQEIVDPSTVGQWEGVRTPPHRFSRAEREAQYETERQLSERTWAESLFALPRAVAQQTYINQAAVRWSAKEGYDLYAVEKALNAQGKSLNESFTWGDVMQNAYLGLGRALGEKLGIIEEEPEGVTDQQWISLQEGVPKHLLYRFDNITNYSQGLAIKNAIISEMNSERELQKLSVAPSYQQLLTGLGGMLLTPDTLAFILPGIGQGAGLVAKGSNLARAVDLSMGAKMRIMGINAGRALDVSAKGITRESVVASSLLNATDIGIKMAALEQMKYYSSVDVERTADPLLSFFHGVQMHYGFATFNIALRAAGNLAKIRAQETKLGNWYITKQETKEILKPLSPFQNPAEIFDLKAEGRGLYRLIPKPEKAETVHANESIVFDLLSKNLKEISKNKHVTITHTDEGFKVLTRPYRDYEVKEIVLEGRKKPTPVEAEVEIPVEEPVAPTAPAEPTPAPVPASKETKTLDKRTREMADAKGGSLWSLVYKPPKPKKTDAELLIEQQAQKAEQRRRLIKKSIESRRLTKQLEKETKESIAQRESFTQQQEKSQSIREQEQQLAELLKKKSELEQWQKDIVDLEQTLQQAKVEAQKAKEIEAQQLSEQSQQKSQEWESTVAELDAKLAELKSQQTPGLTFDEMRSQGESETLALKESIDQGIASQREEKPFGPTYEEMRKRGEAEHALIEPIVVESPAIQSQIDFIFLESPRGITKQEAIERGIVEESTIREVEMAMREVDRKTETTTVAEEIKPDISPTLAEVQAIERSDLRAQRRQQRLDERAKRQQTAQSIQSESEVRTSEQALIPVEARVVTKEETIPASTLAVETETVKIAVEVELEREQLMLEKQIAEVQQNIELSATNKASAEAILKQTQAVVKDSLESTTERLIPMISPEDGGIKINDFTGKESVYGDRYPLIVDLKRLVDTPNLPHAVKAEAEFALKQARKYLDNMRFIQPEEIEQLKQRIGANDSSYNFTVAYDPESTFKVASNILNKSLADVVRDLQSTYIRTNAKGEQKPTPIWVRDTFYTNNDGSYGIREELRWSSNSNIENLLLSIYSSIKKIQNQDATYLPKIVEQREITQTVVQSLAITERSALEEIPKAAEQVAVALAEPIDITAPKSGMIPSFETANTYQKVHVDLVAGTVKFGKEIPQSKIEDYNPERIIPDFEGKTFQLKGDTPFAKNITIDEQYIINGLQTKFPLFMKEGSKYFPVNASALRQAKEFATGYPTAKYPIRYITKASQAKLKIRTENGADQVKFPARLNMAKMNEYVDQMQLGIKTRNKELWKQHFSVLPEISKNMLTNESLSALNVLNSHSAPIPSQFAKTYRAAINRIVTAISEQRPLEDINSDAVNLAKFLVVAEKHFKDHPEAVVKFMSELASANESSQLTGRISISALSKDYIRRMVEC